MSSLHHRMNQLALANNPHVDRNDESDDDQQINRKRSSSKASSKASSRASSRDSRADSESSIPMEEEEETDDLKRKPTVTQRFPASKGRTSAIRKEVQTNVKAIVGDIITGMLIDEVKTKYESILKNSLTIENTPILIQDGIKLRESYAVDDETISMNSILRDLRLSTDGAEFVDWVKIGSNDDLNKKLEQVQIDILQTENTLRNLKVAKKVLQYHLAGRNDVDICALDILIAIWKKKMYELMA